MLRARRKLVIAATLIAAGAALFLSLAREPVYRATATVAFGAEFRPNLAAVPGASAQQGASQTTRPKVLKEAGEALRNELSPDELKSKITAVAVPGSDNVDITAEAGDADEAADIANATALAVTRVLQREVRRDLRAQVAAIQDDRKLADSLRARAAVARPVEVIDEASPPERPASPKPLRDMLFGAFLGFLVGTGGALLRHSFDRRIRAPDDVSRGLDLPVVGHVRESTMGRVDWSEGGSDGGEGLEAFRILRANTSFIAGDTELRKLAVTSPLADEGKSTVAAGYAFASTLAGRQTLLVECDLRRPVLAERFGFDATPGLSDYLSGDAEPGEALRSVLVESPAGDPLPVLPAGTETQQPAELLASPRFADFLEQVGRAYEVVVLDCPPILPVGDTLSLIPKVDVTLLCIRLGETTREQSLAAKASLDRMPHRPAGLVLTGLDPSGENDYYGYYADPRAYSAV